MPIYTRTGDTGKTSLFGGTRVLKCEELVDVYGSIDELNSWIGLIASQIDTPDVQQFLHSIQSDLFTIGSTLAGWSGNFSQLPARVLQMEARIDAAEKEAGKLQTFILPGGTQIASLVHVARAIARRVERQTVGLRERQMQKRREQAPAVRETDMTSIITYLNRLSDFLFMLARFINAQEGKVEILWTGIDRIPKKKYK